jgi:predicted phage tail component-like protein
MMFNGIRKDYLLVLRGRKRPAFAPVTRSFLTMPNRAGAYLQGTQTNVRVIEVPVAIKANATMTLQAMKEDLATWLISDKPERLIFDDEQNRIYYAVVDGNLDFEELVRIGNGTITFICPDPYKYSLAPKGISFSGAGTANTINNGTVETYPIIKATITNAITFLSASSGDDNISIGQPSSVEVTPVNPTTSVFQDGMDSLTGWVQSSITLDGGVKSGTLATSGGSFFASDYGTGPAWHGPAMQKSLSEQVQDFQIDISCKFETTIPSQVGRLEVYLLDINNKVIGKLAMKDYTTTQELTMPEIIIKNDTNSSAILVRNMNDDFDNWYGILRLKRVGQELWATTIRVDPTTAEKLETKERYYYDLNNEYQSKLSSIVVHIGSNSTYTVPAINQIHEISVQKINTLTETQIPIIGMPGDVIIFDHEKNTITRNGESILHEKDLSSKFFPIKKGSSTVTIQPSDSVSANITIQEKYL